MLTPTSLVAALLASVVLLQTSNPPPPDSEIGGGGASWGINSKGDTLRVEGVRNRGGNLGHGAESHKRIPDAIHVGDVEPRPQPPTPEECRINWDAMISCWEHVERPEGTPDEESPDSTPSIPPVTISDLAIFSPAKGAVAGEPDNLGVAGLPTNFVTEAQAHVRSGELFGFPVDVRFTPVLYTFRYGDGESRTTGSPGRSWADLGQAQFTPTETSHTYSERGTYEAQVDIAYTAEIDFGVGWFLVDGQLNIPGPAQQIRIFEARTALVAHTCTEQPSAPGC